MEAKIDGLVTLLKSTQQPLLNNELLGFAPDPGSTNIPQAPPTPSPTNGRYPSVPSSQLGDWEGRSPRVPAPIKDSSCSMRVADLNTDRAPEPHHFFSMRPSPEEAEVLLNRFRQMTPYFPFMVLPPNTSARDLLQDRPFLYHCIMAVSCRSPSQQIAFGEEIMQYLGDQMLAKRAKSLDLLLGILTYTGCFVLLAAAILLQVASPMVDLDKVTDLNSDHAGTILIFLSRRICVSCCNSQLPWCST
jgi:hypothetical protein